jgi:hypothetical protein
VGIRRVKMEYHVNNENKLTVGDLLADPAGNKYIVRDTKWDNTHSQYSSKVLAECYAGPNVGKSRWVDHFLATQYKES